MNRRQAFRSLAAPLVAVAAPAAAQMVREVVPADEDFPDGKVVITISGKELVEQLVRELERGGHASQRLRRCLL